MRHLLTAAFLVGAGLVYAADGPPANQLVVEGIVRGGGGLPVAGALVRLGEDRLDSNAATEQTTDSSGHFACAVKADSSAVLTVQAKGYAPELEKLDVGRDNIRADFQLSPGNRLHGKVIDEEGRPIADAEIRPNTWRGYRTLDAVMRTNQSGDFDWEDAPSDGVSAVVHASGYLTRANLLLVPDNHDIVITMISPRLVHGTVIDGATGLPVARFRLIVEMASAADQPLKPFPPVEMKDGKFKFAQRLPYPFGEIRIEADGFAPVESRLFRTADADVALEFKLKPDGSKATRPGP